MGVQQAIILFILRCVLTHVDGSKDCEPGKYRVGFLEGPCHPCPETLKGCDDQGSDADICKLSCSK